MTDSAQVRERGIRQNGQWVFSLNQLAVVAVIVVIAILLTIAALMAGPAQQAAPLGSAPNDTTAAQEHAETYTNSNASKQALAGFSLFSLWLIAGSVSIARSRDAREFRFGTPDQPVASTVSPPGDT